MHTGISVVRHLAWAVSDFQCMHVTIKSATQTCLSASIAIDRGSHLVLSTLEWLHAIVHTNSGDVFGDELLLTEPVMQDCLQLRFTETHRTVAFALFAVQTYGNPLPGVRPASNSFSPLTS